jgi:long-chain acyl-CoA synthetase
MRSWRPPSLTRRSSEEVVAFVQLLPGSAATPSDLMAHAMRLLAPYKRPSEIIVLDLLSAASTGKILKHQLADAVRSGNRADIGG